MVGSFQHKSAVQPDVLTNPSYKASFFDLFSQETSLVLDFFPQNIWPFVLFPTDCGLENTKRDRQQERGGATYAFLPTALRALGEGLVALYIPDMQAQRVEASPTILQAIRYIDVDWQERLALDWRS